MSAFFYKLWVQWWLRERNVRWGNRDSFLTKLSGPQKITPLVKLKAAGVWVDRAENAFLQDYILWREGVFSFLWNEKWVGTDYHLIYFMHVTSLLHPEITKAVTMRVYWGYISWVLHDYASSQGYKQGYYFEIQNKTLIKVLCNHRQKCNLCWVWCKPVFNVVRTTLCRMKLLIV